MNSVFGLLAQDDLDVTCGTDDPMDCLQGDDKQVGFEVLTAIGVFIGLELTPIVFFVLAAASSKAMGGPSLLSDECSLPLTSFVHVYAIVTRKDIRVIIVPMVHL